ncbi:MAG TPA: hypothetical protein VFP21_05810 [Solirubrobacterales bacterium]|nr:hypothetical protein [Solirubrobacterales bacterium]
MAVMAREAWTDERMDDLKENVNQRFDEVDKRFDRFEGEVKARFDKVDKRFDRVEGDIRELQRDMKQGFESMQRTMIIGFVTVFSSIAASLVAAVIAAISLA